MKPFQNIMQSGQSASMACAFALAAAPLLSGTALAVDKARYDYQGAAASCEAALPMYEANLRSRPLGLSNSGTATSFVTCNIMGSDPTGQRGAYQVQVNVANNNTTSKQVACTLVVVYRMSGETVDKTAYRTKTATLASNGGGFISWVPTDLTGTSGGPEISKSGVTCTLPGKTTLQYTGNYYREDVGT